MSRHRPLAVGRRVHRRPMVAALACTLAAAVLPATPGPASAVEPVPAWRTTGPLNTSRNGAVATVLGGTPCNAVPRPNYCGRVLVSGGANDGGELASAEIYDPASGSWALTGSMQTTHGDAHLAVALTTGQVLVVGGPAHPTSAELYDPASGTWRAAAPAPFDVYTDAAAPLPGGKALLLTYDKNHGVTAAALFDPTADSGRGTWTLAAPTTQPHPEPTLTVLRSGKLLAVGGASAELYDPTTQVWSPAGALPSPTSSPGIDCDRVHCHSATLLDDGDVLVVGLLRVDAALQNLPDNDGVALYQPADNTWTSLDGDDGTRPPPRQPALRLPDGRVLVAGRTDVAGQVVGPTVFDPASESWAPAGSMVIGRENPATALLDDGDVLVAGGNPDASSSSGNTPEAELFGWSATVAPSITGLQPPSAVAGQSATAPTVTITGAGLDAPGRVVKFGGLAATVVESSATQLVVAAPAQAAAGRVAVTVRTGSGGGAVESAVTADTFFTYYAAELASQPGSPLVTARTGHTATTLADGRVLVVGGTPAPGGQPLSSVELYDPAGNGSWTQVATLARARWHHAAVLLGDGSVLVTGGFEVPDQVPDVAPVPDPDPSIPDPELRSTELLVPGPAGQPWQVLQAGDLVTGRADHTATVLPTGRVLVTGGTARDPGGTTTILGATEVYDPATRAWTSAAPMNQPRRRHTATVLTGTACAGGSPPAWCGSVLVAGGDAVSGTTAEIYSPAAGTWAPTAPMGESRSGHTATVTSIADPACGGAGDPGRCAVVVVVGGSTTVAAEAYRPATGEWQPMGRLLRARTGHTTSVLANGDLVVAGGTGDTHPVEVFSATRREWSPIGPLLVTRSGHTASVLPSGDILLAGGCGACTGAPSSVEVLRVPVPPPAPTVAGVDPPAGPSATSTRVVVRGSGLGGVATASFGGVTVRVAAVSDQAVVVVAPPQAQGTVAVVLHGPAGDIASPAAEFTYGPGAWHGAGVVEDEGECGDTCGRYLHAAAPVPGGVLVAGGTTNFFDFARAPTPDRVPRPLASARRYDAATGTWREAAPMATARFAHTATALADGRVLVVGGQDDQGLALDSAEIYDPADESWHDTGSLAVARFSHTATLLGDGRVLVAGGAVTEEQRYLPVATAEVYDPATGLWSPVEAMAAPRSLHTATPLPDGRVLVAGGFTGPSVAASSSGPPQLGGAVLDSAEIFDPLTARWAPTGPMAVRRYTHTATLLAGPRCRRPGALARCGTVVVAGGGAGGDGGLASVEIYDPATGAWRPAPSLRTARAGHTATLLADGSVLVAGGGALFPGDLQPGPLAGAEVFDPDGGWRDTSSLQVRRAGHTATPLADGTVVVAGGYQRVTNAGGVFEVQLCEPGEVYTPAPYVTDVSPAEGLVGQRTDVVLGGTGFAGTSAVAFGDVDVAADGFQVGSPTVLRTRTPPRTTPGAVAVAVVNAGGTSATLSPEGARWFSYLEAGSPVDPTTGGGDLAPCPELPAGPGPGRVLYPSGHYSLVGLPAGTLVAADSPLYAWVDQGAGGRYAVHPATTAVAGGLGYWAYFRCPSLVDAGPATGLAAVALPLGSYHATMVGNPSATAAATVSGHDFAARWDPTMNGGTGGYRLSGYREPQPLEVGAGAWVFSYRDTTVRVAAP